MILELDRIWEESLKNPFYCRLAQAALSSVAPRLVRPQRALWLRLLPRAHVTRAPQHRGGHLASLGIILGADFAELRWGRASAAEPRNRVHERRPLLSADHHDGESSFADQRLVEELRQVWRRVLILEVKDTAENIEC